MYIKINSAELNIQNAPKNKKVSRRLKKTVNTINNYKQIKLHVNRFQRVAFNYAKPF